MCMCACPLPTFASWQCLFVGVQSQPGPAWGPPDRDAAHSDTWPAYAQPLLSHRVHPHALEADSKPAVYAELHT